MGFGDGRCAAGGQQDRERLQAEAAVCAGHAAAVAADPWRRWVFTDSGEKLASAGF